jgi:hypothetical protein
MTVAEPKTLQAVRSFLERQKLTFEESEEQYCTKLKIQNGPQLAYVSVFNTGKIVLGGKDGPLKQLLVQMNEAIAAGQAVPGQALPFEIERFPDAIRERAPDCDPVIIRFVEEAIACVRADALLGAAFMLGAASERAISILIHSYADAIADQANRDKFTSRINGRMISKKFDEFHRSYAGCKSKPTEGVLGHDLDVVIGTMFQFSRITRNEVGHPQIVPDLDRGVILATLGVTGQPEAFLRWGAGGGAIRCCRAASGAGRARSAASKAAG